MGSSRDAEGLRVGLVQRRAVDSHDLDPFYSLLVGGLEEALDAAGATILVVFEDSAEAETAVYRRWGEQGDVDVVVLTDLVERDPRLAECRRLGLDVVVLGLEVPEGVSGIAVDEWHAVRLAADHLHGDGHRDVGHVSGPLALLHTAARSAAFAAAFEVEGSAVVELEGDYSVASGARATRELLSRAPAPTAIVYDNDLMAIGGLRALDELGLRAPDDVSVLAWDDSVHCRLAEPPISVVSRDVHGLGVLLGALIAEGRDSVRVVQAPGVQVVRRETTGPAPR